MNAIKSLDQFLTCGGGGEETDKVGQWKEQPVFNNKILQDGELGSRKCSGLRGDVF